jgi:hypothetical protein
VSFNSKAITHRTWLQPAHTYYTFRKMLDLSEVTWNDIKVPQTERASGNMKQLVYQTSKMEFRNEVVKQ